MFKYKGFTLIELLIVISIISVLAVMGAVVYSGVVRSGYDAKRQSDLRQIQSALEQFRTDQFYYPRNAASCTDGTVVFKTSAPFCDLKSPNGSKTYMNSLPFNAYSTDPSLKYCYKPLEASQTCDNQASVTCDNTPTKKCVSYCLYAKLQNPPSGSTNYPNTGLPDSGCGSANNGDPYNFKVTPP